MTHRPAHTTEKKTTPDRSELVRLLRDGDWGGLARRLGFDVSHRALIPQEALAAWGIDADTAADFDALEVLAAAPAYRLMLVRGGSEYRSLRRLMMDVRRINPEQVVLWWWCRQGTVSVAMVDVGADRKPYVRRMDIDRRTPDPVGLGQWAALSIDDLPDADLADRAGALRRHLGDVLEQERLTREFFAGFKRALERLCDELSDGPSSDRQRHDVALATLLRLVFLYFLQLRGALDGDRRFVLRRLRQARGDGRNFYRSVLRPLFFGALNRPRDERDREADDLGDLPFLNGGLFEPLPIEQSHPELGWPNDVFADVIEGLFEHYHFAVAEMEGADEQRAVDPEMLGRVFEGLMYGETRQSSGSFYTPRDVVRRLVDEAIGGYLADATDLDSKDVQAVLAGKEPRLGEDATARLRDALANVRILDPAVGTGAFLLEALQVLRRCRRALIEPDAGADPLADYRQVRQVIHEHLFGVDIQHTAVRLCELRLWLALLTTLPAMPIDELPPLPNLSHKICVGNSLLSPTDLTSVRCGATSFAALGGAAQRDATRQALAELRDTQAEYLTTHGSAKVAVRRRMDALQKRLQQGMLDARREALAQKLAPIEALESSRDLFDEAVTLSDAQRREAKSLRAQLEAVDEARAALDAGRQAPLAFSYAARFSQLIDQGGFDIIITNPPWVRAQNIDAAQRRVLEERYACYRRRLWPSAQAAGIRAPFGPQVDLAALFVERSLELLRPGGRLCGLVPAKLFSSLHGSALREILAEHALVAIEDYSDAKRRMFDATVYPAMLHVQKRAPRRTEPQRRPLRCAGTTRLSVWRDETRRTWNTRPERLFAANEQPGSPWIFAPPEALRLFERMRSVSRPLGELDALQPQRGLFTGANAIFVHEAGELDDLLGSDARACSLPALSGRDIRPWSVEPTQRILWPYDDHLEFRADLPEAFRRYFAGHAQRLEARSDYRADKPLWQMFRLKDGLIRPKVVWRDLSPKLEAAFAPARVVPLNTVYFIPVCDEPRALLLAALFNSAPLRAVAYALGERARGGWRRHFAWVMRLLPIPERFVSFLEGADDARLADFERIVGAQGAPGADALAAELYGLSEADVDVLRRWRRGAREAA